VALKSDGTLWGWGNAAFGQLAQNFNFDNIIPNQTFRQTTDWRQVAAGAFDTAAVKTDGTLWTWGFNGNGRLGINDTTNRSTPVTTFAGGNRWKQVSAYGHTAAIFYDDPVI
jgi:alpha-tubulin suppressor-like RCC1 family protein